MVLQEPAERVALTAALSGLREGGILGLEWSDSTAGNLPSIALSGTLNLDNMAQCVRLPRQ